MLDETIDSFLDKLAARIPAPGGGATAALHAAQAAALLAMVARYSDGSKYREHATAIAEVLAEAEGLRAECVALMGADASAFGAVAAAYQLPKDSDDQKAARSAAIAAALFTAAQPPAAVIAAAERLLRLAETLEPIGNRNVITDVAAAAEAIRAAVATARINVAVNLGGITDANALKHYTEVMADVDDVIARAGLVSSAILQEIAR